MTGEVILHASCVAVAGRGVLILGPSGGGKSALALALMAMGADLVADDRTRVWRAGDRLRAAAPATIRGRIEARGFGLLTAPAREAEQLVLAVDLAQVETARLPPPRHLPLLGLSLPLRFAVSGPHLGPAILQWLKTGAGEDREA